MSLVAYDSNKFALFSNPDAVNIKQTIEDNLGGETINVAKLERVKIPTAGMTKWNIETMFGDEVLAEIEAIVIFHNPRRVRYKNKYTGEKTRPDCYSLDAKFGIGDPGMECALCPFSQWTNLADGTQQIPSCKLQRDLFLIRPDELLPMVLSLPPTSLAPFNTIMQRLVTRNTPYYGAVLGFSLEKVDNKKVPAYSKVVISVKELLSPEKRAIAAALHDSLKPILSARAKRMAESDGEDVGNEDVLEVAPN